MTLNEEETLYDVLDVPPNASPEEVRKAYFRVRTAYEKESVALYSLVSVEDRDVMLKKIEAAFLVLSDSVKRRSYDQLHGLLQVEEMETSHPKRADDRILNRYSQDSKDKRNGKDAKETIEVIESGDFDFNEDEKSESSGKNPSHPPPFEHRSKESGASEAKAESASGPAPEPGVDATLEQAIANETEWKGAFLKKIREAKNISIEEMSSTTRVSKNYLLAIEAEDFNKLPAAVYVRGFVLQVAKLLKLPADKVAAIYIARCVAAKINSEK